MLQQPLYNSIFFFANKQYLIKSDELLFILQIFFTIIIIKVLNKKMLKNV